MRRREVLKTVCKMGFCSCAGLAVSTTEGADAQKKTNPPQHEKWEIDFMQKRLENLLSSLGTTLKKEDRDKVLKALGRNCGSETVKNYADNPEGFWKWAKSRWIETVDYDKEKGIIRICEKKRKTCNCPLAKFFKVPGYMCVCSTGAQGAIYEKLFGVPVEVKFEESVLTGGERCRFTIKLLPKSEKPPEKND
jgi:predicted hydrocarbon binding protein